MSSFFWGVTLAALASGSVMAADATNASQASRNATETSKSAKLLYVCKDSSMTRRAFAREFGAARFETAEIGIKVVGGNDVSRMLGENFITVARDKARGEKCCAEERCARQSLH